MFRLSILRYLGLFVEHPLVLIEAVKIRPLHMIQRSDTQIREGILQDLERLLEVPKIEDMLCSTPATYPYQGDLQELERPLEVPKIEDMLCSTPVTCPYQRDLQELGRPLEVPKVGNILC